MPATAFAKAGWTANGEGQTVNAASLSSAIPVYPERLLRGVSPGQVCVQLGNSGQPGHSLREVFPMYCKSSIPILLV